jgi:predicted protein tyrosine phosphatase
MRKFTKLHVLSSVEFEKALRNGACRPDDAVVSIGNPGEPLPAGLDPSSRRTLRLEFYDLEAPDRARDKCRIPEREDVEALRAFYGTITGGSVFVHCDNGIGRSASCALCILYLAEGNEAKAARALAEIKPKALPNKRFIIHADALLGSRLISEVYEFYRRRAYRLAFGESREVKDEGAIEELD